MRRSSIQTSVQKPILSSLPILHLIHSQNLSPSHVYLFLQSFFIRSNQNSRVPPSIHHTKFCLYNPFPYHTPFIYKSLYLLPSKCLIHLNYRSQTQSSWVNQLLIISHPPSGISFSSLSHPIKIYTELLIVS